MMLTKRVPKSERDPDDESIVAFPRPRTLSTPARVHVSKYTCTNATQTTPARTRSGVRPPAPCNLTTGGGDRGDTFRNFLPRPHPGRTYSSPDAGGRLLTRFRRASRADPPPDHAPAGPVLLHGAAACSGFKRNAERHGAVQLGVRLAREWRRAWSLQNARYSWLRAFPDVRRGGCRQGEAAFPCRRFYSLLPQRWCCDRLAGTCLRRGSGRRVCG